MDYPEQIAVSARSGKIYVLSRARGNEGFLKDKLPMGMSEYRAWRRRACRPRGKCAAAGAMFLFA